MSNIEQTIEEIEEYIEGCKKQKFTDNIIVDRGTILELLSELKMKMPKEIDRYKKVIANRDAIMNDAQKTADAIIEQANIHREECISEHEIMQQAYAQGNEILAQAGAEAQKVVDDAVGYANDYSMSARRYTDELLAGMQNLIAVTMESTKNQYEKFFASLSDSYDVISSNRNELYPNTEANLEYVSEEEETEDTEE